MRILNILNDCSPNGDQYYLIGAVFELRLASYDLKTVSKMLSVLAQTLPWLLTQLCGRGTYSQATYGLVNVCITGCRKFARTNYVEVEVRLS